MNKIQVLKSELLDTLRANRADHADKVQQARIAYRVAIIDELDRRLREARTGTDIDPGFLHRLPIPRDFTLEYDRAIQQVEWEIRDHVELSAEDFNRYIRDEWEWRQQWAASTETYLAS